MLNFYLKSIIILAVFAIIPLTAKEVNIDYGDPRLDEMLDTCIDGVNHKSKPGPEDSLHMQCAPWKNRSCCTSEISVQAHYQKMYNFDWNHCSHVKTLSPNCSKHFRQDLCFYECSPNIGPWKVKVDMKMRKERFYQVPLCASDCNAWFEDCAEDFTCTDNWTMNFEWLKDIGNRCPKGSSCKTFREIYRNSKYFCETVWDHSWEVVPDHEHCMRLWFDPSAGNPNDDVAKWKAIQIFKNVYNANTGSTFGISGVTLTAMLGIAFTITASLTRFH